MRYLDEFKLICDPFFERSRLSPKPNEYPMVAARDSYDLVYLGKREQGTWTFKLLLEGSGDKMELVLLQSYRRRRVLRPEAKRTLRLPLYYDGNSGCIHVGERNKALDELNLRLPPQPNEMGEVDSDATDESEGESNEDSISVMAPDIASRTPIEGSVTGCSTPGEGGSFSTSTFSVADPWALPDEEEASHNHVQQARGSPIFHGLPAPSPRRGVGGVAKASRRLEPYGRAWVQKRAQTGFCAR